MITRDLDSFVSRDWGAVRAAKDAFWAQRIAQLGPVEGFRIADELRRQVLERDPKWPAAEQRRQDLANHLRLSELFQRAGRPGGR